MIYRLISFFSLFLLLSCATGKDVIVVQYNDSSGVNLLSSPCLVDIEIIALQGEEAPVLGPFVNLVARNDTYYIADPIQSGKVYLFDSDGKYLHSVGEMGRGPKEYLNHTDMIIEDNGHISVYSSYQGTLFTYTMQGHFVESNEFGFKSANYGKAKDFNYHHFGEGSGMPWQLYVSDKQHHVIDSCFSSSDVPFMFKSSPVFTPFEDGLNLCPGYGNQVYWLRDGKVSLSYTFDFGEYTIPSEYFGKGRSDAYDFIMSRTVAIKELFLENQKYAVLQAVVINYEQGLTRFVYGLCEKASASWQWYYMKDGDFMDNYNLKYMDDSYVYFIAEPALMKNTALVEKIPSLAGYTEEDGNVILKCRLR